MIHNDEQAKVAAHTLTVQIGVISALLTSALSTLHDQTGGYSARASGSGEGGGGGATILVNGDQIPVTMVEARAFDERADTAAADLDRLYATIDRGLMALRDASAIVARYGEVVRRKASDDLGLIDAIWCPNCARHGELTARGRRSVCESCYKFELAEGFLPDKPIIDRRKQGRNLTERDIEEARKRNATEAAAAARAKKAEAKAKRKAAKNGSADSPTAADGVLEVCITADVGVVGTSSTVRERGSDVEHVDDMVSRFQAAHE